LNVGQKGDKKEDRKNDLLQGCAETVRQGRVRIEIEKKKKGLFRVHE